MSIMPLTVKGVMPIFWARWFAEKGSSWLMVCIAVRNFCHCWSCFIGNKNVVGIYKYFCFEEQNFDSVFGWHFLEHEFSLV